CRPEEIQDKPLGRTICGEKIVFYRGKENQVAAVEDFCPHRGAPLSLGYVEDGNLVCGYHGLVMGCDGKTVSMPAQRVNGFPCNKAYAVVEKFGFIWVWPGEKALADEAKLPTLEWADHPEWSYGGGLFHIQCDYRLMIDNLMDLTHETYVHSSSIGQKEIDEALPVTKVDGDHVITERYMEN
ncbi:aromatic ring-hydroxylating dioxygenase subunit alpha, partial [Acinetobacter baumannii]